MIAYVENSEESTKRLVELLSEFSKVTGHKINTQKAIKSLYAHSEHVEKEIKDTIPLTIISKKTKYLGVHLAKCVQYLCAEKYKMLMKEIK